MSNDTTLIVGYYGKKNLGDDALLLASTWATQNILNNNDLTCTASDAIDLVNFKQPKPTLQSTQKFPGHNRLLQYRLAWQSKQIVLGGGSVLHSAHDLNIKRLMLKLSSKSQKTSTLSKQHMAVGVGIEAFVNEQAKLACKNFLNECPFIGVRDEKSYQRAKQLAPKANVAMTFDLAPTLLCHQDLIDHKQQLKQDARQQQNHCAEQRFGIAINLCSVPVDGLGNVNVAAEQKRVLQYAKLICKLLETTQEHITLISLNAEPMGATKRLNDDDLLAKVRSNVTIKLADTSLVKRLHLIKYHPDPINFIKILSTFKVVIAMRLHGAILSYIGKTPVIVVNYHDKCKAWCDQVLISSQYRVNLDNFDVKEIHGTIVAGLKYGFTPPIITVKSALKQSLKNWRLSDEQIEYFCDHSAL